jgi:hypothetical protein
VRDVETIDSELRLLAAVRRSIRDHGGDRQVASDELVDERLSALRPPGIRCVGTFKHKASSALLYVRPGVS